MGSWGPGHGFPFVFSLPNILAAVLVPLQCQKDNWPFARRGQSSVHLWTAFWEPKTLLSWALLTCLQIGRRASPKEQQGNWWQFLTDPMTQSVPERAKQDDHWGGSPAHTHTPTSYPKTLVGNLMTISLNCYFQISHTCTEKYHVYPAKPISLKLSDPSYRSGAIVIIAG